MLFDEAGLEMKPKDCSGSRPNCGSDELEYGSIQVDMDATDSVYFLFECSDCAKQGQEVYMLDYLHSIIEKK